MNDLVYEDRTELVYEDPNELVYGDKIELVHGDLERTDVPCVGSLPRDRF